MKTPTLLIFSLFFFLGLVGAAQINDPYSRSRNYSIDEVLGNKPQKSGPGRMTLIVEPGISSLLNRYQKELKADPRIEGFRVQLYFGTRDRATESKTEFLKNYPNVKTYVTWLSPNFRLRVGNFRTQLAADAFVEKIRKYFPAAYTVADEIDLPEIY